MILYDNYDEDFKILVKLTSDYRGIPESAVRRDYITVYLLEKLVNSEFGDVCVFKGGTSLSKCYPGVIERFSEDIDLTYIPKERLTDNQYEKKIKEIELNMSKGMGYSKINEERKKRSKSFYVWFIDETEKVKIEIGSNVRPEPYSKKSMKSFIHEYLESINAHDDIKKYDLNEIAINTLDISRTFVDKLMAVKRHALCGNLNRKVRHIYDVVKLFQTKEIKAFIKDLDGFTKVVKLTKETDMFYLQNKKVQITYSPLDPYDFERWKDTFNSEIKKIYENLHYDLLYTNEAQDFSTAIEIFSEINVLLTSINE